MVILGTQYAGEMKKGIFTIMHYLMPKRGILSLHSGCNVGKNDDVTLFFGLSGENICKHHSTQARMHADDAYMALFREPELKLDFYGVHLILLLIKPLTSY